MPLLDWQFWLVTAFAVGALLVLVRPWLARKRHADTPCASCRMATAGGCARPPQGERLVTLRAPR